MSVKKTIREGEGGSLTLEFKGINASIVNAIRRTVIIDIPAWSINKFEVEENTSPLIDEYITRRISLIPMNNELLKDGEVPPTFLLDIKTTKEGILKVFSQDINPENKDKRKFFRPNMIVTKLKGKDPDKYESLRIRMSAERNTHKYHSSFSSVTAVEYDLKDTSGECKMVINGNGTYKVGTLLNKTLDIIIARLKNVENKLEITELPDNMTKIKIEDEDDTLGQLLQTYIMENYKDVTFISANKPHPLENHIIVEIKTEKSVNKIMTETLAKLVKIFEKFY